MVKSKKTSQMVRTNSDPKQPRLNVIFHGPFLFIYYPGRVEVVTPDTLEHVAVAGTWLGEKLCRPGTLYLAGVPNQQAPVDPNDPVNKDTHVTIRAQDVSINIEQGSYYRFVLPLPWREYALACHHTNRSCEQILVCRCMFPADQNKG
jgi:hypothetical protein